MRGRRRSFRRSSGRRSGRKIRWSGLQYSLATSLESQPDVNEWVSFWVKWPASLANVSVLPPANTVISNEPVDETLVRLRSFWGAGLTVPGTTGVALPINGVFGIIAFDGGEEPVDYMFTVWTHASQTPPPDPLEQIDDDWVIRQPFTNGQLEESFVDTGDGYELAEWSRSMRKLPAGTGLLGLIGVQSLFATASTPVTIRWGGEVRYAVKSGFSI